MDNDTLRLQPQVNIAKAERTSNLRKARTPGWGLWASWALASATLGLAPIANRLIADALAGLPDEHLAFWTTQGLSSVVWVVVATLTAFAQWTVLRLYIPNLGLRQWMLASTLGHLLIGLLYGTGVFAAWIALVIFGTLLAVAFGEKYAIQVQLYTVFIVISAVGLFAAEVLAWAVLGLLQYIALRRFLPNARRRLVIANAGAALALQLITLVVVYAPTGLPVTTELKSTLDPWEQAMVGWTPTLFLSGTITGVTLVHLLRRSSR